MDETITTTLTLTVPAGVEPALALSLLRHRVKAVEATAGPRRRQVGTARDFRLEADALVCTAEIDRERLGGLDGAEFWIDDFPAAPGEES